MEGQEQLLWFFFKKVDEDEMIRIFRKVFQGTAAHIGRLRIIEGRYVVCDINNIKLRIKL
jgi:hypothetical protein